MGCRVCRARKVRCDDRPHGCLNCERLSLACDQYLNKDPSGDSGSSRRPENGNSATRRRTYRSCTSCRAAKVKCDGVRPACRRCRLRSITCIYTAAARPSWVRALGQNVAESSPSSAADSPQEKGHLADLPASPDPLEPLEPPESPETAERITVPPEAISWLWSFKLPQTPDIIIRLVEQYFSSVHSLRCFAFVHKPSYMQQLDAVGIRRSSHDTAPADDSLPPDELALLHIICAHGAKFYALDHREGGTRQLAARLVQTAGHEWAKTAERLIMVDYGRISVPGLMTAVLLHDYRFRLGDFSHALMMSGFTTRMSHALQLNIEPQTPHTGDSTGPSVANCESRRRLMWACYVIDAWAGSGVDQLTLLRDADLHIPLPCNERDFVLQRATRAPAWDPGVPGDQRHPPASDSLMAAYVRLIVIWKRVSRFVKHIDPSDLPWHASSAFSVLDSDLKAWYRSLPRGNLDWSRESLYARLETGQLGALALLHCTYCNAVSDLYRISMPDMYGLGCSTPPSSSAALSMFPTGPPTSTESQMKAAFTAKWQAESIRMSRDIATILAETAVYGARFLADSMLPMFVHNSNRILFYYLIRLLEPSRPDFQAIFHEHVRLVRSNNHVLRLLSAIMPVSKSLLRTSEKWLHKLLRSGHSQRGTDSDNQDGHPPGRPDTSDMDVTQWADRRKGSSDSTYNTPDAVLHPLSLYRLARQAVRDTPRNSNTAFAGGLPPLRSARPLDRGSTNRASDSQHYGMDQDTVDATSCDTSTSMAARSSSSIPSGGLSWNGSTMDSDTLVLQDLQNYPFWDMDTMISLGGGSGGGSNEASVWDDSWLVGGAGSCAQE